MGADSDRCRTGKIDTRPESMVDNLPPVKVMTREQLLGEADR